MTAAGKINASNVTTGDRIIVKARFDAEGHETISESATKTGEGVFVARVIGKDFRAAGRYEARGKYIVHTTAGSFEAAPIQTMWLAPEDNAGVKRAHVEALAEDTHRAELAAVETVPAAEAGAAPAAEEFTPAERAELAADFRTSGALDDAHAEALEIASAQELTLNSQACKVTPISSEHDAPEEIEMAENLTYTGARNYPLANGTTVDLIALVSSVKPSDWVQATEAQPIGTVVYAYAMGELRRGVVVKNTPTKTLVALTTAAASAPGGTTVRVQTATELHTTVYVAPAAEPAQEAEKAPADETPAECPECGGPLASDGVCADDECGADEEPHPECEAKGCDIPEGLGECTRCGAELVEIEVPEDLTLNSHAGKVINMNNASETTETQTPTIVRETTGSGVVKLLERVHERIRQNHPGVPAVVIVTGAGTSMGGAKWGHFRPQGWTAKGEGEGAANTQIHEMFMAGETLAKGARQVLQTMLHESAHAECEALGIQDTSRQGRWHNKAFLAKAKELGLEYKSDKANAQIGYSQVTLTEETLAEYADLLEALETEIHLMVKLPFWLGGGKDGDDEDGGGENIGTKPKAPTQPNTNNVKCVCQCETPNIIRMSRKVLDQGVVTCSDCDEPFTAAA